VRAGKTGPSSEKAAHFLRIQQLKAKPLHKQV